MARRIGIEIGGRQYQVTIDRVGPRYRIECEGRTEWVDNAAVDEHTVSLVIDDHRRESHEIGVLEGREPGEVEIYLRTGVIRARVGGPVGRRAPEVAKTGGDGGPVRITAPMPGKVVKVLATAGDRVTARQGLVVVEAMKMQNELRAPRDGVVADVPVREGMTVEAGRVLAVLE